MLRPRWCHLLRVGHHAGSARFRYRAAFEEGTTYLDGADPATTMTVVPVDGELKSLRWVLAHKNAEMARHAGHADILREQIDGVIGR